MTLLPGSRGFVVAMVTAQILTQIGAFTLPALLPEMMARWSLSATEAGWLIGVFFAAYVPAVPVLPEGDKEFRARRVSGWPRAGKVFYPAHHPRAEEFLRFITGFPMTRFKDPTDAFTQLLARVIGTEVEERPATSSFMAAAGVRTS